MQGSAIPLWMMGAESLDKNNYDYALLYFSQAIGLDNDEPMFMHSMAEAYEAIGNINMALEFYKITLERYKQENSGPIKRIEGTIRNIASQLENRGKYNIYTNMLNTS